MARLDFDRVSWLASEVGVGADVLRDSRDAGAAGVVLPAAAFGNTGGAGDCHYACNGASNAAATASGNLMTALRQDVTRFGDVMAVFQRTDAESADRICAAQRRSLDVYTAHVHSHDEVPLVGEFTHEWDDYLRGRQIDHLVDAVGANPTPAVVAMDANLSLTPGEENSFDRYGPEALRRFTGELGFESAAEVGPTSSNGDGRAIDHVFASPDVTTGSPVHVPGEPSDHDGQRVDIDVPRW
jgi:hypothetical protein